MLTLKDLPVAVLCGGKGTRLGKLTENLPKILVDVDGSPFIYQQLQLLVRQGITRVFYLTGPNPIAQFTHRGSEIQVIPGTYDGTGAAVKDALHHLGEEFAVLYGDSYLPAPWQPILDSWNAIPPERRGCQVTLYGCRDWGFNIFHRRAFEEDWPRPYGLQRIFIREWQKQRLSFYHIDEPFYEMGSPKGLKELEAYLVAQQNLPAAPQRARGPYRRWAARADGD